MNFHKYQGWNRVPWVPKFRSIAGVCHTLWVNIFLSNEITLSWTKPPNPNNKLTLCAIPSCLRSRDALPTAESSRLRDLCWRRHPLVGFLVCRRMRRQGSRGYFTTKSSLNTGVWTCFHLPKWGPQTPRPQELEVIEFYQRQVQLLENLLAQRYKKAGGTVEDGTILELNGSKWRISHSYVWLPDGNHLEISSFGIWMLLSTMGFSFGVVPRHSLSDLFSAVLEIFEFWFDESAERSFFGMTHIFSAPIISPGIEFFPHQNRDEMTGNWLIPVPPVQWCANSRSRPEFNNFP